MKELSDTFGSTDYDKCWSLQKKLNEVIREINKIKIQIAKLNNGE